MNNMRDSVLDGAGDIKRAVGHATGRVLGSFKRARTRARRRAADNLQTVRDAALGYIGERKSQAQNAEASLERRIRRQPLTSVLVAAGAGFLMGALWHRRR